MASFENVQHKEIKNLTAELDAVVRQLGGSVGWKYADAALLRGRTPASAPYFETWNLSTLQPRQIVG